MENKYYLTSGEELYHYGVVGMKWGIRRAQHKAASNERLRNKALALDAKSANFNKKSEKLHASKDLGRYNRAAKKSAKYAKRAANLGKKALNSDNEFKRSTLEYRAEKAKYKSAKAKVDANRISKTTGYGAKAMKYSIKSDKVAKKAAKARMKIANNKAYISAMNRKISNLSQEELAGAYSFVNGTLKD